MRATNIQGNPRTKDIESCTVRVSPAMDEEVEDVTHPQALAYKNHLRVDSSLEGLIVKGDSKGLCRQCSWMIN